MPLPFWVHCNMCGAQHNKDSNHYLLSCSHIMCKYCLQPTAGRICPACNADVRYEDISNLPEELKKNFQTNIQDLFEEPLKVLDFQQMQSRDLAKKTHDYKKKARQAQKIYEQELAEAKKLKEELDRCIQKRQLMQKKLKQIYIQNKMKQQGENDRNPENLTKFSNFSSEKSRSSLKPSSSSRVRSHFFDQHSQMRPDFSSHSNDFFGSNCSSPPRKKSKHFEHTQSTRTPFFS